MTYLALSLAVARISVPPYVYRAFLISLVVLTCILGPRRFSWSLMRMLTLKTANIFFLSISFTDRSRSNFCQVVVI